MCRSTPAVGAEVGITFGRRCSAARSAACRHGQRGRTPRRGADERIDRFIEIGFTITDANDLGLALCTTALGRADEADAHFTAAIELSERAGALSYYARYHLDWAETLAERGDTKDARQHAEIAADVGANIGMTGPYGVVARAERLLIGL